VWIVALATVHAVWARIVLAAAALVWAQGLISLTMRIRRLDDTAGD
jgi:hypothetical protein